MFIRSKDVDHLLNWTEISDAIFQAHKRPRALSEDLYLEQSEQGYFNRCAWIQGLGLATKSVTVFPNNRSKIPPIPSIQGAVLLFDDDSGALKAVIDGQLVTKWKTTGDSILGSRLLARENSKTLLVVGAGVVGTHQILAYHELFPQLERIQLWNRSQEKANTVQQQLAKKHIDIEVVADLQAACQQSDIITCATMSVDPVLKGAWVQPGTHIDLIGAFRPDMREVDDELIKKSLIYVDSRQSTLEDIGELYIPLSTGVIDESAVLAEFYNLCNEPLAPRQKDTITVFKNGGGGYLDLICADYIYQKHIQAMTS